MAREHLQVLVEGRRSQRKTGKAGGPIVRAGQDRVSQQGSAALVVNQGPDNLATGLGGATEALATPQILEAVGRDPAVES
jgi:hypothetical protein